jgi:Ca2+-binding RTX toxin-like protein
MATINHSSGADIIVPNNNGTTYRGLGGDDTYILSNSIAANAAITIVDTSGANKIQLVNGLSVASTKFAADAVQLTLSNGAVVTINGASNFDFDLGGNATSGTSGSVTDFAGFAAGAGVASLPASGSVAGASNVSVQGTAWSGGTGGSYTVAKSSASVSEGSSVTFTITASSAVSADTTFSWTVIGDTNGATVDKAGTSDIDILSGNATIASGASSTTFTVTASSDSIVEGIEGIKVSVFDASSNALSSDTILVNNSGSAATSQSFTMTAGVNEQIGGSGNDTFDASTTVNSLNDFDNIDGAGGTDTVVAKTSSAAAASVAPVMNNVEIISITHDSTTNQNGGDVFTVNLAEATSINKVMNVTSNDAVTFSNLSQLVDAEIKSSQSDTTIEYDAAALAGTSDSMTVTIKGTNNTDLSIADDNPLASSVLENLTISSLSVANTLDLLSTTGVNVPQLTVTGDKKLTITAALDAGIATIDSSASTGGLTLSAAPGYGGVTVTGGSGAETITVSTGNVNVSGGAGNDTLTAAATWNGYDAFDGGDGHDTLAVSSAFEPLNTGATSANTIVAGLSNVEELLVTGTTAVSFDKNMGSLTTIDIKDTGTQTVNLNDGYTGATTIQIGSTTAANGRAVDKVVNTANVDLSIYARISDIDGDTNTKTTITGGYGQDTLYLYSIPQDHDSNSDTALSNTLLLGDGNNNNITNVDKIVIVDVTTGADPVIDTGDYALTNAAGAAIPLTIDGTQLDVGENLTTGVGGTSVAKQNVTGGAGNDTLTGGTKADTLDGGAGDDTLAGTNGSNVMSGGAGNDSITLGDGADNIDGGAGNDTIVAGANLLLTDTIDGGDGVDTMTIGANIASYTVMGGVSNIEVIAPAGGEDITAAGSLGGATTFSFANAGDNILTTSAGWTADTTVIITGDASSNADSVVNSANVTLTVKGNGADFDTGTTLTGGTGTDTLLITADGGTADLDAVTNFETYTVVDAVTAGTDLTINPNETTLKAQVIDGSALDGSAQNDETLSVDGASATGTLDITGGGGADSLYGGTLNDTIVAGGGADSINGNGGADNLSGGAANDTFLIDSKTDFTSAIGSDTIDGGAGTDTITWTGAMNMAAASLASISNTEKWSIAAGSDFTISDAVLTNNPGLTFLFAGSGTLSGGEDTAGAALMTESINYSSTAAGDMKLVGSSADDSFTFNNTASLTVADTIDGNAGTDIINLTNNTSATDATGNAVTAGFDVDVKGIEKIVVVDAAADYAGNALITITSGYTDAALTIDASALDVDPTSEATGETLTVTNNDNVALTVIGGAARDTVTGGSGADDISGGGSADELTGGDGNDTIDGGAGADALNGGAGTDSIVGGDGNDTINVTTFTDFKTSGGVETVDGGAGTDTLAFAQSNTALSLTAPEISKLFGIEAITLSSGNAASSITLGNETFTNNGPALTITTNAGSAVTTVDASAVSNGSITVISEAANASNDTLVGGTGDDVFRFGSNGLAATDSVNGNGGNDTIQIDTTTASAKSAVIDFNDVSNVETVTTYVSPTTGLDTVAVSIEILPHDTLNATTTATMTIDLSPSTQNGAEFNNDNSEATTLVDFTVIGTAKTDTLIGSAGDDNIDGGGVTAADTINGGAGNDILTGAAGNDTMDGGTGNDTITTNGGADSIDGGTGNDIIDGGDGADTIDGEAGLDTITLGLGIDTLEYDAAADSTGSTKDIITDFTQSTISAVTGDTVTAGDNITITFGTLADDKVFTLADKGDVANAGLAGAAIDGVLGSFVFADDSSTIYLDFNGDGLLNASDLQITTTGLTSFHSNDINTIVTMGGNGEAGTGGNGDDSITGGAGADTLTGNYGNDTLSGAGGTDSLYGNGGNDVLTDLAGASSLSGGAGDDTLDGGAGIDSLTGGTGDDVFKILDDAIADRDVITDFEDAGAVVGDTIQLLASETTDGTTAGTAPVIHIQTADATAGANLTISDSITTSTADIIILPSNNQAEAALVATDDGTQLLELITAANEATATGIVAVQSSQVYFVAYDDGKAFIYLGIEGGNTVLAAGEFEVVGVVNGITADSFVAADFAVLG